MTQYESHDVYNGDDREHSHRTETHLYDCINEDDLYVSMKQVQGNVENLMVVSATEQNEHDITQGSTP